MPKNKSEGATVQKEPISFEQLESLILSQYPRGCEYKILKIVKHKPADEDDNTSRLAVIIYDPETMLAKLDILVQPIDAACVVEIDNNIPIEISPDFEQAMKSSRGKINQTYHASFGGELLNQDGSFKTAKKRDSVGDSSAVISKVLAFIRKSIPKQSSKR